MPRPKTNIPTYFFLALGAAFSFVWCDGREAYAGADRHDLTIELLLNSGKLLVQDEIRMNHPGKKELEFTIAARAMIRSVQVNGTARDYSFRSGKLTVPLGRPAGQHPLAVSISYEAVFDDPVPEDPVSFDNPGFGVSGTIMKKGAFLLPGSGWYPQIPGNRSSINLKVIAPQGIYAVTSGRLVRHEDNDSKSLSIWEVDNPAKGLPLAAGPYVRRSMMSGSIPILTYFFPETDSLSEKYLKAAASHIQFYQELHGPYPFPKFAVVENFFPTGYGFPSFTLLGTSVLRLPFIPETSLRHEVAHSWWGNGVLVDYDSGNWCEGLTTYVADYLSREEASPDEGKLYRQQILQDYATLVAAGDDFPLRSFASRVSPSTRAVGYGKAAFVFHMIHQRVGDDLFWKSLRRVFKERLFLETSWEDFRNAFVETGKWERHEAQAFLDQWLNRAGAPVLELQNVQLKRVESGWSVDGIVAQNSPYYGLDVMLRLQTDAERIEKPMSLKGGASSFSIQTDRIPKNLFVDPDSNLFRMLYQEEIPATVNSVKGSKDIVPVLSEGVRPALREVFQILLASLNQGHLSILREVDINSLGSTDRHFFFFGLPRSEKLRAVIAWRPEGLTLATEKFSLKDVFSSDASDCLFTAFSDPKTGGKLVALFLPLSGTDDDSLITAARKITHYGKYSYLSFSHGTIQAKGTWPASHSPLIVHFKESP